VHAGWAERWGTQRYLELDWPYLSVGTVDALTGGQRSGDGIPIIERLTTSYRCPAAGRD
jgi:hypothetical protein